MKFLSIAFLLLIAVFSAFAQVKTDTERAQMGQTAAAEYAAKYVTEGVKLHSQGLYVGASLMMSKALAIDPTNRDALIYRGIDFYSDKQFERARIDLGRAAKFYPDDYFAGFQYGVALQMSGFDQEAFPYFQKAVAAEPSKIIFRFYAGGAALRSGKFRECVENFEAYAAANPAEANNANKGYLYLSLAECQIQLGNTAAAKIALDKSYQFSRNTSWGYLSPIIEVGGAACRSNADSHQKKAEEFINKKGEWEKAYREIFNALKCDANHLKSRRLQLVIEAHSKSMNYQALSHYNQLVKIDAETTPDVLDRFETSYSNRIQPKKDSNRYVDENETLRAQAVKYMEWYPGVNIVPLMPEAEKTAAAYVERARTYYESNGRTYETPGFGPILLNLNEALFLEPNKDDALLLRARAFAVFPERAMRFLAWRDATAALKINPNLALAYNVRGLILRQEKNYPDAIAELNKGLAINPKEDRIYVNLAVAYSSQEKHDLALKSYTRAIEIAPNFENWYLFRGNEYQKLNKFTEAANDYRKALQINDKLLDARLNLVQILEKTGDQTGANSEVLALLRQSPDDPRVKTLAERYQNASAVNASVNSSIFTAETLTFRLETNRLVEDDNNLMTRIETLIADTGKNQSATDIYANREKQFSTLDIIEEHKNKILENSRAIISKANNFLIKYEKNKDLDQQAVQLAKTRIIESNNLIQKMNEYAEDLKARKRRLQGIN